MNASTMTLEEWAHANGLWPEDLTRRQVNYYLRHVRMVPDSYIRRAQREVRKLEANGYPMEGIEYHDHLEARITEYVNAQYR